MSSAVDIDGFVKDPNLLTELCREVIDRIDSGPDNSKTSEKEAQLQEIAKAVERLEKKSVAVPDALRAEKTRLAAERHARRGTAWTSRACSSLIPLAQADGLKKKGSVLLPCPRVTHGRD
jgi:hypothetical protein